MVSGEEKGIDIVLSYVSNSNMVYLLKESVLCVFINICKTVVYFWLGKWSPSKRKCQRQLSEGENTLLTGLSLSSSNMNVYYGTRGDFASEITCQNRTSVVALLLSFLARPPRDSEVYVALALNHIQPSDHTMTSFFSFYGFCLLLTFSLLFFFRMDMPTLAVDSSLLPSFSLQGKK